MSDRVDFYNETAKRCNGRPDGWLWFAASWADAPPGFCRLEGAIPIGKRRDGRPRWPARKRCDVVWMSATDLDETRRQWEEATGKCARCQGDGQTIASAKLTANGVERTYRPCRDCAGSGKASAKAATDPVPGT